MCRCGVVFPRRSVQHVPFARAHMAHDRNLQRVVCSHRLCTKGVLTATRVLSVGHQKYSNHINPTRTSEKSDSRCPKAKTTVVTPGRPSYK